jgi:hypothetical protein
VPHNALAAIAVSAEAEAVMHIAVFRKLRPTDMHPRLLKFPDQMHGKKPSSFKLAFSKMETKPVGEACD